MILNCNKATMGGRALTHWWFVPFEPTKDWVLVFADPRNIALTARGRRYGFPLDLVLDPQLFQGPHSSGVPFGISHIYWCCVGDLLVTLHSYRKVVTCQSGHPARHWTISRQYLAQLLSPYDASAGLSFRIDSVGWSPWISCGTWKRRVAQSSQRTFECEHAWYSWVGRTCTGKLVHPAGINLSESRVRGYGRLGGHYLIIENFHQLNLNNLTSN